MPAYAVRITETITYTMHVMADNERQALDAGVDALLKGDRAASVESRSAHAVQLEQVPSTLLDTPADSNQLHLFTKEGEPGVTTTQ